MLAESRLLPEKKLEAVRRSVDRMEGPPRAKDLARSLVKRELLTSWQAEQLLAGRRHFLIGDYRLLEPREAPAGGEGHRSYLAQRIETGKLVVAEPLPKRLVDDEAAKARFVARAKVAAKVRRPELASLVKIKRCGGRHYLLRQHVDGQDLRQHVKAAGPLPIADAVEAVRRAAMALAYVHRGKIAHGAVRPRHLVLRDDGQLVLTGILSPVPRDLAAADDEAPMLEAAECLAPELCGDDPRPTPASDIYALGCTFYFLLTGKAPFDEPTVGERLLGHQRHKPPGILARRPGVPDAVLKLCRHLMDKSPEQRPATGEEAARELTKLARKLPEKPSLFAAIASQESKGDAEAVKEDRAPPAGNVAKSKPNNGEAAEDGASDREASKKAVDVSATAAAGVVRDDAVAVPEEEIGEGAEGPAVTGATSETAAEDTAIRSDHSAAQAAPAPTKRKKVKPHQALPAKPRSAKTKAADAGGEGTPSPETKAHQGDAPKVGPPGQTAAAAIGAADNPLGLDTGDQSAGGRLMAQRRGRPRRAGTTKSSAAAGGGQQPGFLRRHALWLGIGGGVLLLLVAATVGLTVLFVMDRDATTVADRPSADETTPDANAADDSGDADNDASSDSAAGSDDSSGEPADGQGSTDSSSSAASPADDSDPLSLDLGLDDPMPIAPTGAGDNSATDAPDAEATEGDDAGEGAEGDGSDGGPEGGDIVRPASATTDADNGQPVANNPGEDDSASAEGAGPEPTASAGGAATDTAGQTEANTETEPEREPLPENPFQDFPATKPLPPASQASADSAGPEVVLGKLYAAKNSSWIVVLTGGDAILSSGEFTMTRASGMNPDWLIRLSFESGETADVARIWHDADSQQLKFRWLPAAAEHDQVALLRYCGLRVRLGGKEQTLTFHEPAPAPPLVVDWSQPRLTIDLPSASVPSQDSLKLAVTEVVGAPSGFATEPKEGGAEKGQPMLLNVIRMDHNKNQMPGVVLQLRFNIASDEIKLIAKLMQPQPGVLGQLRRLSADQRKEAEKQLNKLNKEFKKARGNNRIRIEAQRQQLVQMMWYYDLAQRDQPLKIHYRLYLEANGVETDIFNSKLPGGVAGGVAGEAAQ